ncbi:hypothetical protein ACF0H5_023499 [Mactra antiquata]
MATGGGDPENETSIDVAGFMQAFEDGDDDTTGNISMFCRACLHPYKGEEKSGTIVLKCGRCGQTDTILEQEVGSLNPQEWIGNLMMNKFVQVLKEQEDLSKTLLDPYYADDEFQKVCIALSEFTYRINKITHSLLELADLLGFLTEEEIDRVNEWHNYEDDGDTIIDFKPIQEIRAILELHNILNARIAELKDNNEGNDNTESSESDSNNVDGTNGNKDFTNRADSGDKTNEKENGIEGQSSGTNYERCKKLPREKKDAIVTQVNDFLDTLTPTIRNLIDSLISKHNLPINTLYNVQQRVIAKQHEPAAEDTSEDDTEENETKNVEDSTVSEADARGEDKNTDELTASEANTKSQDKNTDELTASEADTKSQDKNADELTVTETTEENGANNVDETSKTASNDDIVDGDTIWQDKNVDKTTVAEDNEDKGRSEDNKSSNQIDGGDNNDDARSQEVDAEETKDEDDIDLELVVTPEVREVIKQKFYLRFGSEADQSNTTNLFNKFAEEDQARAEENAGNNTETDIRDVIDRTIPLADYNPAEHLIMNIYTFATEFVREMHSQKDDSFRDRKDRALDNVKAKCDHVREEMARVEKCVIVELEKAYEKKRKRVENQSKQVDENRAKLAEAERLLFFYARTGQADKLQELVDQINQWREDN